MRQVRKTRALRSARPIRVRSKSDAAAAPNPKRIIETLKRVVRDEADALRELLDCIDEHYVRAVELILKTRGRVIVTGVGKSGIVARKIVATLSSTGTPAMFLHPGDAMHGDLGAVTANDVVIAIGKSGESEELIELIPLFKRLSIPVIAITCNRKSSLASKADILLFAGSGREACPFDLAPTSSTATAMAVGDALALAVMECRNFKPADYALLHPGGRLGRRLWLKVADVMIPRERLPLLDPATATVEDVIGVLSQCGFGVAWFSRDGETLYGLLTDGDLRRILGAHKKAVFDLELDTVINRNPIVIESQAMATDALKFMESRERPLNLMPVVEGKRLVGLVRLHEFLTVA
jgi:arabinose-5-phosphate isomerase